MDFLFFSTLEHNTPTRLVVSYDIACQWEKNLWSRLAKYERFDSPDKNSVTFLIPKFHLPAHQESCRSKYSFNFQPNVGCTDGEGVERAWAYVNDFANSTKEMGPGSRHDRLNDAFGDYNWHKITAIGE